MNIATIKVSGVKAVTNDYPTIPAGIVGATVTFEFTDPAWDGLSKTAVFRGCVTRDVLMTGNIVRIPAETVEREGPRLLVGVYGTDVASNIVIHTVWVNLGSVRSAADPSGDPGTDPDLPVWAQLQARVEALEPGAPSDPDSPGTPGLPGEDGEDGGYYTPAVTQPSSDTVEFAFSPSKPDMPAVDPVQVKLPVGQGSGGNVELDTTLTQSGKAADAKAVGDALNKKLSADTLTDAVNDALAQAKASGEFDGAPGKDGKDGQPGKDGEPGAPGYTPVRGTDYYTEADKTEMVNAVLSALPTWTGGSY